MDNHETEQDKNTDSAFGVGVKRVVMPFVDSKHDGGKRRFIRTAKAWYAKTALDDQDLEVFNVGVYHDEGGTAGEFTVRWERLGGKLTPRLLAFDDSWSALLEFSGLLADMARVDGKDITPDEFHDILLKAGIEDVTPLTIRKTNELCV